MQGSAKVTFTIKDLSFFLNSLKNSRNCVQITSERGPVNEPRLVGSMAQFKKLYGSSSSDDVLRRAFDRGAQLYVNRIVHYTDVTDDQTITAVKATYTLKDALDRDTLRVDAKDYGDKGNKIVATVSLTSGETEFFDLNITYSPDTDLNETYTYLTMDNDSERYAPKLVNLSSNLIQLVDLEAGNPFEGDTVTVDDTTLTAGVGFEINIGDIPSMATSLADALAVEDTVVAVADDNEINLTAAAAGAAGNAIVLSTVSNGNNITVSGATLAGGANAVAASGDITYGAPNNGDTVNVDGNVFTKVAAAPGANEFTTIGELTTLIDNLANVGAVNDGVTITVTASVAGAAGNAIVFSSAQFVLDPLGGTLSGGADAIAATGKITISQNPSTIDNPAPIANKNLAGGVSGLVGLADADWIGASESSTGFQAFNDVDDAFGLATIESTSPAVITAGLAYAASRRDMIYYCEPPSTVRDGQKAVDFRLGQGDFEHSTFNTPHGAMYFGRPIILDLQTSERIDISNIGDVFGAHAYSESESEIWYPVAGSRRGLIPNTLGIHYNLGANSLESERDLVADNQINPIVDFRNNEGTVIWGNRTLQRQPSALQSLHIMRLIIMMRKALLKINRVDLFELNDPVTWRTIYNRIDPWMDDLKGRRAFYDYRIECDQNVNSIEEAVLNTPERVDRGEFRCQIFIKPTRSLEYLMIEAVITKTSADFTELFNVAA